MMTLMVYPNVLFLFDNFVVEVWIHKVPEMFHYFTSFLIYPNSSTWSKKAASSLTPSAYVVVT